MLECPLCDTMMVLLYDDDDVPCAFYCAGDDHKETIS